MSRMWSLLPLRVPTRPRTRSSAQGGPRAVQDAPALASQPSRAGRRRRSRVEIAVEKGFARSSARCSTPPQSGRDYPALQIERLNRALRLADARIARETERRPCDDKAYAAGGCATKSSNPTATGRCRRTFDPPGGGDAIFTHKSLISHVQNAPLVGFFALSH
jgi:hypothetical protein